jgi:hypothetical protein
MKTKEELQEMAQLVRIHEANCGLLFPSRDETSFRLAIMKKLAQQLSLKELRAATLDGGPGVGNDKDARLPRREGNNAAR